jgi:hypothetical protein
MSDTPDQIEIPDKTGGPWWTLPLLAMLEFCFVGLAILCLRDRIEGAPLYSASWWLTLAVATLLSVANAVLIVVGIALPLKTSGTPRSLRINGDGIFLPYNPEVVRWDDIDSYYVQEKPWMKGGAMQFLYIELKRRRVSFSNPFGLKKVMLLGREVYDNDEIRSCMNLIDRFRV